MEGCASKYEFVYVTLPLNPLPREGDLPSLRSKDSQCYFSFSSVNDFSSFEICTPSHYALAAALRAALRAARRSCHEAIEA